MELKQSGAFEISYLSMTWFFLFFHQVLFMISDWVACCGYGWSVQKGTNYNNLIKFLIIKMI